MLPGRPLAKILAEDRARARRRLLARGALYALLGVVVLALIFVFVNRRTISLAIRSSDEMSRGKEWAARMDSSEDVLAYIVEHPGDVSIAMWDLGHHADGLFLNADVQRPVASTVKIQVLAAYSAAVSHGVLRDDESIDLSAWDAYYVTNTDGGAHLEALHSMGLDLGASAKVHLRDVVHAMIRYSDNAATDYILSRVGRASADATPRLLGLTVQEEPAHPMVGEVFIWSTPTSEPTAARLARLVAMSRTDYVDTVWDGSKALSTSGNEDAKTLRDEGVDLALQEQEAFASKLSIRGTAEGYAYLMQKIARRDLAGADMVYDELAWPMKGGTIADQFDEFGTKGGSLPGVLTAACFARPRGGHLKVLALFFSDLPGALWLGMSGSLVHQSFARRLLLDDGFRAKVKSRLDALSGGDAGLDGAARPSDAGEDADEPGLGIVVPFDAAEPTLDELAEDAGGPLEDPSPARRPRKAPRR